jgi:hypothetical protein
MLASFPHVEFSSQLSTENSWYLFCSFPFFFSSSFDIKRWLGEKYDGIRACWDPRTKQLYPRYCLRDFPSFPS